MNPLETELKQLLAGVIDAEPGKIFSDRSFSEQSIGASDLRDFSDAVRRRFQVSVPNLLWQCPSITSLRAYLAQAPIGDATADAELPDPFLDLGFREGLPDAMFYE